MYSIYNKKDYLKYDEEFRMITDFLKKLRDFQFIVILYLLLETLFSIPLMVLFRKIFLIN
jgi:hypothetical protein